MGWLMVICLINSKVWLSCSFVECFLGYSLSNVVPVMLVLLASVFINLNILEPVWVASWFFVIVIVALNKWLP